MREPYVIARHWKDAVSLVPPEAFNGRPRLAMAATDETGVLYVEFLEHAWLSYASWENDGSENAESEAIMGLLSLLSRYLQGYGVFTIHGGSLNRKE